MGMTVRPVGTLVVKSWTCRPASSKGRAHNPACTPALARALQLRCGVWGHRSLSLPRRLVPCQALSCGLMHLRKRSPKGQANQTT